MISIAELETELQEYVDSPDNRLTKVQKNLVMKRIRQSVVPSVVPVLVDPIPDIEPEKAINPLIYVAGLAICFLVTEVLHGFGF